jgi:hypothetical protein
VRARHNRCLQFGEYSRRFFLLPRFVLHDEKLPITVLALRLSKEDRAARPKVGCWLLAVWATELVSIETKANFRHGITLMRSIGWMETMLV